MKGSSVQPKKSKLLIKRLLSEAGSFNAASMKHGVMGTAFDVFNVPLRSSWSYENHLEKFSEIMRVTPEMARALENPRVPLALLKYAPVTVAVQAVMLATNNPDDPYAVEDRWMQACGMV